MGIHFGNGRPGVVSEYYTAEQLAIRTQMSKKTIYKLGDEGILPVLKLVRNVRYPKKETDEILASNTRHPKLRNALRKGAEETSFPKCA